MLLLRRRPPVWRCCAPTTTVRTALPLNKVPMGMGHRCYSANSSTTEQPVPLAHTRNIGIIAHIDAVSLYSARFLVGSDWEGIGDWGGDWGLGRGIGLTLCARGKLRRQRECCITAALRRGLEVSIFSPSPLSPLPLLCDTCTATRGSVASLHWACPPPQSRDLTAP